MPCTIELHRKARKLLDDERLPKDVRERLQERLREISEKPTYEKRLRGRLKSCYRARVGDYRIAYYIPKECQVYVVSIGRRESFYKSLWSR